MPRPGPRTPEELERLREISKIGAAVRRGERPPKQTRTVNQLSILDCWPSLVEYEDPVTGAIGEKIVTWDTLTSDDVRTLVVENPLNLERLLQLSTFIVTRLERARADMTLNWTRIDSERMKSLKDIDGRVLQATKFHSELLKMQHDWDESERLRMEIVRPVIQNVFAIVRLHVTDEATLSQIASSLIALEGSAQQMLTGGK